MKATGKRRILHWLGGRILLDEGDGDEV